MTLSVGDQERAERLLKSSTTKRNESASLITSILELVNKVEENNDVIPVLQARVKYIELVMTDFRLEQDDILNQLITLSRDSELASTHVPIGRKLFDNYYLIKASMTALGLDKSQIPATTNSINLPKIQLLTFDGDTLRWCSFRNTFASLVHNNPQLPAVQKFHYLIPSLISSAAFMVRSVPIPDS